MNEQTWTRQMVVEKLKVGLGLNGDYQSNAPFSLIDLSQTTTDSIPLIAASLVRELFEDRIIGPPQPGQITYRLNLEQRLLLIEKTGDGVAVVALGSTRLGFQSGPRGATSESELQTLLREYSVSEERIEEAIASLKAGKTTVSI